MKELFKTIAEVHPLLPGWCSLDKALTLASLVVAYRPEVTVEIGVFGGASFIPMALAHKAIGHGVAIGIDPWDTKIAVKVQPTEADRKWWSEMNMDTIHHNFITRIQAWNLYPFSDIRRQQSNQVQPPRAISLLHIDGGHDATAINDTARFAPKVVLGGFVVMDDIGAFGNSTTISVQRLLGMGFKQLYALGTGAVFQRMQ